MPEGSWAIGPIPSSEDRRRAPSDQHLTTVGAPFHRRIGKFEEHVSLWGLSFVKIGRDVWNMPTRLKASTMPSIAFFELPTAPPTGSSARGKMPRTWPSTRSLGPPFTGGWSVQNRRLGLPPSRPTLPSTSGVGEDGHRPTNRPNPPTRSTAAGSTWSGRWNAYRAVNETRLFSATSPIFPNRRPPLHCASRPEASNSTPHGPWPLSSGSCRNHDPRRWCCHV